MSAVLIKVIVNITERETSENFHDVNLNPSTRKIFLTEVIIYSNFTNLIARSNAFSEANFPEIIWFI